MVKETIGGKSTKGETLEPDEPKKESPVVEAVSGPKEPAIDYLGKNGTMSDEDISSDDEDRLLSDASLPSDIAVDDSLITESHQDDDPFESLSGSEMENSPAVRYESDGSSLEIPETQSDDESMASMSSSILGEIEGFVYHDIDDIRIATERICTRTYPHSGTTIFKREFSFNF